MQGKITIRWTLLLVALVLLFMLDLSMGSVRISLAEILKILVTGESSQEVLSDIVWNFRMTRAITCVLAGAALAVAGLQMQTLFRNAMGLRYIACMERLPVFVCLPLAGLLACGCGGGASKSSGAIAMSATRSQQPQGG